MSEATSFYWGHQGWEYVDLGRIWQAGLFVGLLLWLFLMLRVIAPALREKGEHRQLVLVFTLSAGAIAVFYGAGLITRKTHAAWWNTGDGGSYLWVEVLRVLPNGHRISVCD
jgi:nitric oxide reductase subunit B